MVALVSQRRYGQDCESEESFDGMHLDDKLTPRRCDA